MTIHRRAIALLIFIAAARPGAAQETPAPFTLLFDTRKASAAPLAGDVLIARTGWRAVAEDNTAHVFTGDTVFLNDRIAVVLRRAGTGAEVYAFTPQGPRRRALLAPRPGAAKLGAVKIAENTTSAVALTAAFTTQAGQSVAMRLRLTAGDMTLEILPGKGAKRLFVQCETQYVVVPDFFADDLVFSSQTSPGGRAPLPVDNQILGLSGGGNAVVMCVWEAGGQQAEAVFGGTGAGRAIRGCEIDCAPGKRVWVAFLEQPGIWHDRAIRPGDETKDITLGWTPPFPAKWRGNLVPQTPVAGSWNFAAGREPNFTSYELGTIVYPFWLDAGRAHMRVPGPGWAVAVIYPIDRSRATPLTAFCPADVLRSTLGVGPCQYILAAEGLGSDAPPTPAQVADWVERLFKRKRDTRQADAIRERLDAMKHHVRLTSQRIDQYGACAAQVVRLCADDADAGQAAETLRAVAGGLALHLKHERAALDAPRDAERIAAAIVALIGKKDALPECRRLAAELHAVGAHQDTSLSKCRMTIRRLRLQCRILAAGDPRAAPLVKKVLAHIEQIRKRK